MTKQDLNDYRFLKLNIKTLEEKYEELLGSSVQGVKFENTGAKKSDGNVHSNVEILAMKRLELKDKIEQMQIKAVDKEIEVWDFIDHTREECMRGMLISRFVKGSSWRKIGWEFYGGSEEGARKAVNRYLDKNLKN